MCQSESPNEAGNTWLVGWMISTGWYLKTRENQESSQQKTHTLLPSIRKSMHNWHIYYIFGGHPSSLETFVSFYCSMKLLVLIKSLNTLSNRYKSHIVGKRKHNSGCWGCIRLLTECIFQHVTILTAFSKLRMSTAVMVVQLLADIFRWCIQGLLQWPHHPF